MMAHHYQSKKNPKQTKDKTKKGQQFLFLRCCSYEASKPGKKDELRKVASATVVKTASPLSMISIFPGEMSPENLNA